jgi:hypothetical protein
MSGESLNEKVTLLKRFRAKSSIDIFRSLMLSMQQRLCLKIALSD